MACLPNGIRRMLDGCDKKRITLGRGENAVYRCENGLYLKCGTGVESLKREKERLLWLENRLRVPRVVAFEESSAKDETSSPAAFLLTEALDGAPLCDERFLKEPKRLISSLAEAISEVHSIGIGDCPFTAERIPQAVDSDSVFCHGDFCLPNIVYDNGRLGYLDLGDAGVGDRWLDYAWCLWSLGYNLKTDTYRNDLLHALGIDFDSEKYRRYTEE